MPCEKEENKVKPDAQHTLAYVSNRAITVRLEKSQSELFLQLENSVDWIMI